jgi:hypothetical protein
VDLSGLIFVALAVAWAAYLIPKALRHHDEVTQGRSVDRFSRSMRVVARREPVSASAARLVVGPAPTSVAGEATGAAAAAVPPPAEPLAVRRAASARATRRRRRVLAVLLLGLVGVVVACATHRLTWAYVAIPGGLLVAWLVACRLMVKAERRHPAVPAYDVVDDAADDETSTSIPLQTVTVPSAGATAPRDPALWDPVPVTLPTYVSKPPARRSVRTIDLDSTGVWTSGRTEADSALAREADAADRAERVRRHAGGKGESGEEAVGS